MAGVGDSIKKSEATRKPAYHRKWVSEDLGAATISGQAVGRKVLVEETRDRNRKSV